MIRSTVSFLMIFGWLSLAAQEKIEEIHNENQVLTALVIEDDTIFISHLDKVTVSSPREFSTSEEYQLYRKYKRYAAKVYPYASEAIRLIAELEDKTADMKRSKKKRYAKKRKKELSQQFKKELKNLTKTQGQILIEMIEKELNQSMFSILKEFRGGLTAGSWQTTSKMFGYNLKEKYTPGQDKIMDIVLHDFDISLNRTNNYGPN